MDRWWYIAPLIVGLFGCPGPGPGPTPSPSPDPSPICQPGDTCGCWHRPPGEDWQKLPDCVDPTPQPGCVLEGEPTVPAPIHQNTLGDSVNQAIVSLYPNCDIGGLCLLGDETQQHFQAAVEAKLRLMGLCAGQHTPSTDEIAVAGDKADPWQGFHIFVGDDSSGPVPPGGARRTVKWSPAAYTGSWLPPGTDEPTPPPGAACSNPIPPKVGKWGGPKEHLAWYDSTPKFYNREAIRWDGTLAVGYCSSLGIEELWCPARSECPGVKCAERQSCERIGVSGLESGKPLWRCSDGPVEVNPANPFQARCDLGASWIEVCAADGTACSRTVL